MAYNSFGRKEYGRIFVKNESDIEKVKSVIKAMDEFEYRYLPIDLIGVFNPQIIHGDGKTFIDVPVAYTYKFDSLDLNELQVRCWLKGIQVFCVMSGNDYMAFPEEID